MKKKKKVIFIRGIVLVIVLVILVSSYIKNTIEKNKQINQIVQNLEDGTKLNISKKLNKTKKIKEFEISDIQLTKDEEQTKLYAIVTNNGKEKTEMTLINIDFYDKDNKKMGSTIGIISPLEPSATTQLNVSTQGDYIEANNFKITINNKSEV